MTIKELIQHLQKVENQELEVVTHEGPFKGYTRVVDADEIDGKYVLFNTEPFVDDEYVKSL